MLGSYTNLSIKYANHHPMSGTLHYRADRLWQKCGMVDSLHFEIVTEVNELSPFRPNLATGDRGERKQRAVEGSGGAHVVEYAANDTWSAIGNSQKHRCVPFRSDKGSLLFDGVQYLKAQRRRLVP